LYLEEALSDAQSKLCNDVDHEILLFQNQKKIPGELGGGSLYRIIFAGMMRRTDEAKNPVQRAAIALESWRRELI
jgi:hypothetical protein